MWQGWGAQRFSLRSQEIFINFGRKKETAAKKDAVGRGPTRVTSLVVVGNSSQEREEGEMEKTRSLPRDATTTTVSAVREFHRAFDATAAEEDGGTFSMVHLL